MDDLKGEVVKILETIHDPVEKISFQNHLYGCVVVLEQIVEERGDISGTIFTDDEGEMFNLYDDFDSIGTYYGFCDNNKLGFRASDEYRNKWMKIYTNGSDGDINTRKLDAFEDGVFKELIEKCKGVPYFEASLATGELNEEWTQKLADIIHEKLQRKAKIVYGKTRRAKLRRNLTPVHKRAGTRKTRRKNRDII
jgi:hypothetical protein